MPRHHAPIFATYLCYYLPTVRKTILFGVGLYMCAVPMLVSADVIDDLKTQIQSLFVSISQLQTSLQVASAASSFDATKPRFNIVWLEPHSINTSVVGRAGTLSSTDLRNIVDSYRALGAGTLVVAYTEYFGCFIYHPAQYFSFYSYATGATTVSTDPAHRCNLLSDGDFLGVILDQASKNGMKVILGLSNGGDQYLLSDIDSYLRTGSTQYVPQTPGHMLNDRLSQATNVAASLSKDLNAQYGSSPAFAGWYLTFETDCLDVGVNYYKPVADALKKLTPGKLVMISPTADAKICYNAQSYANAVLGIKVDIYSYQDAIGSGYRRINGIGQNFFTEAARDLRRSEITSVLQNLKLTHAWTGTTFWINTEAWRMDGSCGYGCSFPGDWTSVKKQLDSWSAIAGNNLMLNEGFLQFDFGIPNAKLSNATSRAAAENFTQQYAAYLSVAPPPAPTTFTVSCNTNRECSLSWSAVSGATSYMPIIYVPIADSCPIYWTDDGTSIVNQNRECYLPSWTSTSIQTAPLIAGHNYVAYVYSQNAGGLSATAAGPRYFTPAAPPAPTLSATPNPCTIQSGQSTCTSTVSWSAPSTQIVQVWVKTPTTASAIFACTTGSGNKIAPWITTAGDTFSVYNTTNCTTNPTSGVADSSVTVTGIKQSSVPTTTLSASPTSITSGQSSTLTWSSTNATSCTPSGFTGSGTSGTATVRPTQTTAYSVSCTGAGGTASKSATVSVSPAPKFVINDRVRTTANLNVRSSPSATATRLGTEPLGALGTVIGGPQNGGGYTWWNIRWDNSLSGWSAQAYLQKVTVSAAAPATTASVPITHTLALGWTGEEVSALQAALKQLGVFKDDITGYFGVLTEAAVKQFQLQNNLAAVSIVGPQTRAILNEMTR